MISTHSVVDIEDRLTQHGVTLVSIDTKLYVIGGEHYMAAAYPGVRMLWARLNPPQLLQSIRIKEHNFDRYDVSPDGRLLVTGPWRKRGIDLWDLKSGSHLDSFGPNHIADVLFDSTGRYVLAESDDRVFVWDTVGGRELRLRGCKSAQGACMRLRDQTILVPVPQQSGAYLFDSTDARLELVDVKDTQNMDSARWSPDERFLLMRGDANRLTLRCELREEPLWSVQYPEDEFWLSYYSFSGDGELIGFQNETGKLGSVVLDAHSGAVMSHLDVRIGDARPFINASVMTGDGYIVSLATGEEKSGVSEFKWWQAIGA